MEREPPGWPDLAWKVPSMTPIRMRQAIFCSSSFWIASINIIPFGIGS